MASAEFDHRIEEKRPTVQVGDPVHREAAARGLPRADGVRRGRRDPGHGRGRPHLLGGRDGRQGRPRHRARPRPRADARARHDRLRDDALGEPGAHADGAPPGEAWRGRGDLPEMGARLRRCRPHHRRPSLPRQPARRRGRRPADQGARRRGAGIRPAMGRAEAACAARRVEPSARRRRRRRAAEADRLARPLLAPLGLRAIRPSRAGQHRAAPRRRRGGRAASTAATGRSPSRST